MDRAESRQLQGEGALSHHKESSGSTGYRQRTRAFSRVVENTPGELAFDVGCAVNQSLESWERSQTPMSDYSISSRPPLMSKSSSASLTSISSTESDEGSTSTLSESGEPSADSFPTWNDLMGLGNPCDFMDARQSSVLSLLITGQISEEDRVRLPLDLLKVLCMQAAGELHFANELLIKMERLLKHASLSEFGAAGVKGKIECLRKTISHLRTDIEECRETFNQGLRVKTRGKINPLYEDMPKGKCSLGMETKNHVETLIATWIELILSMEEMRKAMPSAETLFADNVEDDGQAATAGKHSKDGIKELKENVAATKKFWKSVETCLKDKSYPLFMLVPEERKSHCHELVCERFDLPPALPFARDLVSDRGSGTPECPSPWVLKKAKVVRSLSVSRTYNCQTVEEAEQELKEIQDQELEDAKQAVVDDFPYQSLPPFSSRPARYFDYQPVAIHGLSRIKDKALRENKKIADKIYFFDENVPRKEVNEQLSAHREVQQLRAIGIPSIQEVLDDIVHKLEDMKRKEIRKKERSLKSQIKKLQDTVSRKIKPPLFGSYSSPAIVASRQAENAGVMVPENMVKEMKETPPADACHTRSRTRSEGDS